MSKKIYKKNFQMCKLPRIIQDAILEAHVLAAKQVKYGSQANLNDLEQEILALENNQEILNKSFIFKSWGQVLNYYFNDELETIKKNSPYSFLDIV